MSKLNERKTVSIERMIDYANGYLSSDFDGADSKECQAQRQGVIDLLETALAFAQRYRGYSYLDEKVITKSKPGIRWSNAQEDWLADTDPTRRRYA